MKQFKESNMGFEQQAAKGKRPDPGKIPPKNK
jgi:hypothetical protein